MSISNEALQKVNKLDSYASFSELFMAPLRDRSIKLPSADC
jgi:hypothetical protein